MRLLHGTRPHGLGGKIREVVVGDLLEASWVTCYDHVEELRFAFAGTVLVCDAKRAFGWIVGEDYLRVYVGVGSLTLGRPEPGADYESMWEPQRGP